MTIFLALLAFILLFGMIGDRDNERIKNFTYGFVTTIAGIVVLYMIR